MILEKELIKESNKNYKNKSLSSSVLGVYTIVGGELLPNFSRKEENMIYVAGSLMAVYALYSGIKYISHNWKNKE